MKVASFIAWADQPLSPPKKHKVYSKNHIYFVELDPTTQTSTAYRLNSRKPLWTIKDWFRIAEITNDGSTLFVGNESNLISQNYDKKMIMVSVYKDGKLIAEYRLEEIIQDFSKLQKTVSHFQWGNYHGLDSDQNFVIKTVEERTIKFSPKTGNMVKKEEFQRKPLKKFGRVNQNKVI